MDKIKICFLEKNIVNLKTDKEKIDFFIKYMSLEDKKYNFEWNEINPDYLFVNECIYYGSTQKEIKKMYNKIILNDPITIFVAGECIEPDLNIFDYAIVFDRHIFNSDRIIRIPYFVKFKNFIINDKNDIKNIEDAKNELSKKKAFCSFIYSNKRAHFMRDKLFNDISNKYKLVNSYGRHLKNTTITDKEVLNEKNFRLQSIKIKSLHKFSISSENATYDGYTSEKFITSLEAHSIPIYWGDKTIVEEFNENAFINANKYRTTDELIEVIKKIDNDDELWCKMIMEPWQSEEQEKKSKLDIDNYYKFIDNIFSKKEYKKPYGFHPNNYKQSFCKWTIPTLYTKLKNKVIKVVKK